MEFRMKYLTWSLSLLGLLTIFGCASGEPLVEETDVLTISASPATITNFGESSIVTVRLFHSNGRPVPDGARVFLDADGGTIVDEVIIEDGRARAPFYSDANVGTVTITAISGSLGLDGSINTQIEVIDRAVEVGGVVLTVNPSNVDRAGGRVDISATAFDPLGEPIANKTAVFSSDYGSLVSNGALLRTNNLGQVFDRLDLSRLPESVSSVTVNVEIAGVPATKNITVTDNQSPLAEFSFSPTDTQEGEPVFFDASASEDPDGEIVDYDWNFGDGAGGSGREVSHTFPQARSYQVRLTVTDNQGATHTAFQTVDIGDNQPPTADFSISPDAPRTNQLVTFDGGLSTDPDGSIATYSWSLGNGVTREGQTVTTAYPAAGSYTVTLNVVDDKGKTATVNKTVSITGNQAPTASIEASATTVRIGEIITFNATGSSDPDGTIEEYAWQFAPGIVDTDPVTTYGWFQAGVYVVVLTVTDNDGAQDFASQIITVTDNTPPSPSFVFSPNQPLIFETVTFNAETSTDPDGTIEDYRWSFGDGTTARGISVTHRYDIAGQYTVILEAIDNDFASSFTEQTITISQGAAPQARLSISPTSLTSDGGQVVLDASATTDSEDPDGLRYFFSVSSAGPVTIEHNDRESPVALATVAPAAAGSRIIFEVEVRDSQANSDRQSQTLEITAGQTGAPPSAALDISPDVLNVAGGEIILDASGSSDPDGTLEALQFEFTAQSAGRVSVGEFQTNGFLATVTVSPLEGETSIDPNARVIFTALATDQDQQVDSAQALLTFTLGEPGNAPSAALVTDPVGPIAAPNPGETLQILLDGRGSTDVEDGDDLTYSFTGKRNGDPSTTIPNVDDDPRLALASYTGLQSGDFLIFTLVVTDSDGTQDTATVTVQIIDP